MEVIDRLAGLGCRDEDRALVVLEHVEPRLHIAGVVLAEFGGEGKIGAQ